MSFYLEPRWYGSEDEALKFARTCVTSTNWGGYVPLVLPDLHHSLAYFQQRAVLPEYWHRLEVWNDLQSAYAKLFALNPDDSSLHNNYARDAYLCCQYDEFFAQLKLARPTNFYVFGGEKAFRVMLESAATAPPAGPLK
jgi:hypothetical protein